MFDFAVDLNGSSCVGDFNSCGEREAFRERVDMEVPGRGDPRATSNDAILWLGSGVLLRVVLGEVGGSDMPGSA